MDIILPDTFLIRFQNWSYIYMDWGFFSKKMVKKTILEGELKNLTLQMTNSDAYSWCVS